MAHAHAPQAAVRQDRTRFLNRLEALLEQMHIKLSSFVSDLLGVSARRMLEAVAEGATDPVAVAALADTNLRATPEQLREALAACAHLSPVYRRLLKMELKQLPFLEQQNHKLEQEIAQLLQPYLRTGRGSRPIEQWCCSLSPIRSMVPSSVRHTVVTACSSIQADSLQKST